MVLDKLVHIIINPRHTTIKLHRITTGPNQEELEEA
jgi:hypothetical protein